MSWSTLLSGELPSKLHSHYCQVVALRDTVPESGVQCPVPFQISADSPQNIKASEVPVVILSEFYELVAVDVFASYQIYRFITVYIPPNTTSATFANFVYALRSVCDDEKICIILGDFNRPDILWENGQATQFPPSARPLPQCGG